MVRLLRVFSRYWVAKLARESSPVRYPTGLGPQDHRNTKEWSLECMGANPECRELVRSNHKCFGVNVGS